MQYLAASNRLINQKLALAMLRNFLMHDARRLHEACVLAKQTSGFETKITWLWLLWSGWQSSYLSPQHSVTVYGARANEGCTSSSFTDRLTRECHLSLYPSCNVSTYVHPEDGYFEVALDRTRHYIDYSHYSNMRQASGKINHSSISGKVLFSPWRTTSAWNRVTKNSISITSTVKLTYSE